MPTTVRVEEDVKEEFDRLQGLVQSETGARITHSALLARLLRIARRHEAELYKEPSERPRWTREQIRRRLDELAVDIGPSDVRDIDDVLYGERP